MPTLTDEVQLVCGLSQEEIRKLAEDALQAMAEAEEAMEACLGPVKIFYEAVLEDEDYCKSVLQSLSNQFEHERRELEDTRDRLIRAIQEYEEATDVARALSAVHSA